jgi:hypothetical protein
MFILAICLSLFILNHAPDFSNFISIVYNILVYNFFLLKIELTIHYFYLLLYKYLVCYIKLIHFCTRLFVHFILNSKITQPTFQIALYYILSAVKTGFQSYCDTSYSRGDVNQMWIRKNSKDLLVYM